MVLSKAGEKLDKMAMHDAAMQAYLNTQPEGLTQTIGAHNGLFSIRDIPETTRQEDARVAGSNLAYALIKLHTAITVGAHDEAVQLRNEAQESMDNYSQFKPANGEAISRNTLQITLAMSSAIDQNMLEQRQKTRSKAFRA